MTRPLIMADDILLSSLLYELRQVGELIGWRNEPQERRDNIQGIYTYGHPAVTRELIECLPALRVISNFGVGVDHIDVRAAAERGIPVGNTPGVLDKATADLGFTLLLASARRVTEAIAMQSTAAEAESARGPFLGRDVHGSTLGIIGLGRIGLQVARRALGFDMQVLYYQRRECVAGQLPAGPRFVPLKQLLEESDFVMLTVPLTPSTYRLINSQRLSWMKPSATLVNIARGPIVDTEALTQALAERRLAAAALDVADPEPLPADHPLRRMPNVMITPHIGSATHETRARMAELSVANLRAGLEGRPLPAMAEIVGA